jgi:predicted membrane channel-forming protein YqfA (hemolysin III family)
MLAVSPYPHTALAAWQLALMAVVAIGGVAVWLGAVFYAAREPRSRDHAAASGAPAQDPAAAPPSETTPVEAGAATSAAGHGSGREQHAA